MPTAHLTDRSIVTVSGPDAEHFLQNILTCDLEALGHGEAKPGALLTPQGKILFDFLISRSGEAGIRLECRADIADDFVRRLMLYKLRAKVEITKQDQQVVAVSWDSDSGSGAADAAALRDLRFPPGVTVRRHYGDAAAADVDVGAWHAFRIANGIAESGSDYQLGDAFPHDVLLDQTGGVGFKKGCYVGQEVVSRMQHRGTARRRVLIAEAGTALPAPGTAVSAAGKTIGELGSSAGDKGLTLVRIDRVKEALDSGQEISAGGVTLRLSIPAWASFTFPETGAEHA